MFYFEGEIRIESIHLIILILLSAQFVVVEILAWHAAHYFGYSVHGLVITAAILTVAQVDTNINDNEILQSHFGLMCNV